MTAAVTSYRPSVGVGGILAGAWRNLRSRASELWPLLPPASAAIVLEGILGHAAKASGVVSPFAPLKLAQTLVAEVSGAIVAGIALRILLDRGRAAWRLDRELGAFVALTVLIQLVTNLGFLLPPIIHPTKAQDLKRLGDTILFGIASFWLIARLSLWPVARLMGERRARAVDSLYRMKGMVWTYWIALMVAVIPPVIPAAILEWPFLRHGQIVWLVLAAPFMAVAGLTGAAVGAEIFRARWLRD